LSINSSAKAYEHFLIIVCILICLLAIFAIYRYLKVNYQNRKLNEQRFDRIKPLYEKLGSGQAVNSQDVLPFAENVITRGMTFHLLGSHDKRIYFQKSITPW